MWATCCNGLTIGLAVCITIRIWHLQRQHRPVLADAMVFRLFAAAMAAEIGAIVLELCQSNPNWLAVLIDLCAVAFMLPIRRLWRLSRSRGPRTAGLPSSDATGDKETQ